MRFPVYIRGNHQDVHTRALIDSGASGLFIHWNFVRKHRIPTKAYAKPKIVRNVDNSTNILGKITNYVETTLKVGDHEEQAKFSVTDIGEDDLILGLPWLRKHNPALNWRNGHMLFQDCPLSCELTMRKKRRQKKKTLKTIKKHYASRIIGGVRTTLRKTVAKTTFSERIQKRLDQHRYRIRVKEAGQAFIKTMELGEDDEVWWTPGFEEEEEEEFVRRASKSTELAEEASKTKETRTYEEIVPEQYQQFRKVFSDEESKRFPTSKPWDHHIDFKPDAVPRNTCKVYPLTPTEQIALDKFLNEHLERGTIRKSSSPLASPFFFVKKKDGELRPVQDYRKVNEMTIKNRYPLPLTTELFDRMANASIFTKMDVRYGYTNILIADGDQWKAAFLTNRGLYEPMVMFFGLTNSPATFQMFV
jgi:hypothetical protein